MAVWWSRAAASGPRLTARSTAGSCAPSTRRPTPGATVGDALYLAGGCDADHVFRQAYRLSGGAWTELPPLPRPLALAGAAAIGTRVYVVGGCDQPVTLAGASNGCLVLDTNDLVSGWKQLAPLPGPARAIPAVAAEGGRLLVFGGSAAAGGDKVDDFADAYGYDPEAGAWKRLRDLPVALGGPAAVGTGRGHALVLGGASQLTAAGFVPDVWCYDLASNDYAWAGELPVAMGAGGFVRCGDLILGAGGEDRPRSRTATTFIGTLQSRPSVRWTLEPAARLGDALRDEDGAWAVADGKITQSDTAAAPSRLFFPARAFGDLDFVVRFKLTDPGASVRAADLFFGARDTAAFDYLHLDSQHNMAAFARSTPHEFWTQPQRFMKAGVTFGAPHEVRVVTRGNRWLAFLDGRRVGEVTREPLGPGVVGLGTCSAGAQFRDLRVIGTPVTLQQPFGAGPTRSLRVAAAPPGPGSWRPGLLADDTGAIRLGFDRPDGGRTVLLSTDGGLRWSPTTTEVPPATLGPLAEGPWSELREPGCTTLKCRDGELIVAFKARQGGLLVARRRVADGRWEGPVQVSRRGSGPAALAELPDGRVLVAHGDDQARSLRVAGVSRQGAELATALLGAEPPLPGPKPLPDVVCPVSPDNPRNTEGSIVELRDGRLLLAYTRFYGGGGDDARADISARLSTDGGQTWSAPFLLQPNDGAQNVMSVSLLRLDNGELMLGYLRKNSDADCRMIVRRSRDDGVTWGSEVCATEPTNYYVVNNDRIIQLRSGRLLVPAADHGDSARGLPAVAVCYLSDDRGATWRRGEGRVELPGVGCQEPGLVELTGQSHGEGRRTLMIIRNSLGAIRVAVSADGGSTWGAPEATTLTTPVAPATVKRITSTGDLLMVWNNSSGPRVPLTTAISRDDGKTWECIRDLEPKGSSFAYTSVTFVGDTAVLSYWTALPGGLALKVRRVPIAWFYGQGDALP